MNSFPTFASKIDLKFMKENSIVLNCDWNICDILLWGKKENVPNDKNEKKVKLIMLRRNFLIKETRKQCLRIYVGRNLLDEWSVPYAAWLLHEIKIFCKEMNFCKTL